MKYVATLYLTIEAPNMRIANDIAAAMLATLDAFDDDATDATVETYTYSVEEDDG